MRWLLLILALTIPGQIVLAQEQENKLVDRMLRPDMSLANPAQDKKFTGTGATSVEKKFVAHQFYAGGERAARDFTGTKDFSAQQFGTAPFARAGQAKASVQSVAPTAEFRTGESSLIRTSAAQDKVVPTRDYVEARPFLSQGTRQKILSQQDQPLTIEQVRDLLNKGK